MTLEELNIAWSVPMLVSGLAIAGVGLLWLPTRLRQPKTPLVLLLIGLLIAATPSAISRLMPIDLSERDKLVNNERHLTLTGWDKNDYAILRNKTDAVFLQMANPDVTDNTLDFLKGFEKLRTLDLNDTKVTDAGLAKIAALPKLDTLYLERTAVTDEGVKKHLVPHTNLRVLWLRSTKVGKETADEFKAGKEGRRIVINSPRPDEN